MKKRKTRGERGDPGARGQGCWRPVGSAAVRGATVTPNRLHSIGALLPVLPRDSCFVPLVCEVTWGTGWGPPGRLCRHISQLFNGLVHRKHCLSRGVPKGRTPAHLPAPIPRSPLAAPPPPARERESDQLPAVGQGGLGRARHGSRGEHSLVFPPLLGVRRCPAERRATSAPAPSGGAARRARALAPGSAPCEAAWSRDADESAAGGAEPTPRFRCVWGVERGPLDVVSPAELSPTCFAPLQRLRGTKRGKWFKGQRRSLG